MKSIISILLFFALPFVIFGVGNSQQYAKDVQKLYILAKNGEAINGELLLKEDGLLREGFFGFVYEGTYIEENRPVAIKFVKNEYEKECKNEMAMYSYLRAYKNPSVEKYGIPAVYHYGRWNHYILMAFTKLDMDLKQVAEKVTSFDDHPLDILILLRDFVYQSKYIHSHGVRHDCINRRNIMFRGHQSFLTNFKFSSKIMGGYGFATDDYVTFIYTICTVMNKDWFKERYNDNERRINDLSNTKLEGVIKAFAVEAFTDVESKRFPNYDKLEKIVSAEIKRTQPLFSRNRALKFSWMPTDAETSPARNITDIADPKFIDFTNFAYPQKEHLPQGQGTSKMSVGSSSN